MRHELAPRAGVEADERLVQQQQPRAHGEHAGQRQAALLAAGERVRVPLARTAAGGRPTSSSASSTAAATSASGQPSRRGPKATSSRAVAANSCSSGVWKTRPTCALQRRVAGAAGPSAVEQHGAGLGRVQATDHLQQRRLAGARRAQQRQRAAGRQLEATRRAGPGSARRASS